MSIWIHIYISLAMLLTMTSQIQQIMRNILILSLSLSPFRSLILKFSASQLIFPISSFKAFCLSSNYNHMILQRTGALVSTPETICSDKHLNIGRSEVKSLQRTKLFTYTIQQGFISLLKSKIYITRQIPNPINVCQEWHCFSQFLLIISFDPEVFQFKIYLNIFCYFSM